MVSEGGEIMQDVALESFPRNSIDALAMLFVQNQDLKGKSPEEICEIYWNAYFRIRNCNGDVRNAARESVKK